MVSAQITLTVCYIFQCRRPGGLMVSALDSGSDGTGSSPVAGALRCVLGQDTLLS